MSIEKRLDMLNNRTGEDTQFFGVEVEVLQIDNSCPSVNFNVVAIPRKWRNPKQRSRGFRGSARHNESNTGILSRALMDTAEQ